MTIKEIELYNFRIYKGENIIDDRTWIIKAHHPMLF